MAGCYGGGMATRAADPWKDLAVIDSRAPRFNQAVVAALSLVALATGAWPLLALLGLQLAVSVAFGRRYCLPCVFYFQVLQPRLGEGPLEDSRAPRFANLVGAGFLNAAALAWAAGFGRAGFALGAVVAALASVAVVSGLCVGCEAYKLLARLSGIKGGSIDQIDLQQLGIRHDGEVVVLFTHPLCADCQTVEPRLSSGGRTVVRVDVSRRKDLAKKYGVSVVPFAVAVAADGRVVAQLA